MNYSRIMQYAKDMVHGAIAQHSLKSKLILFSARTIMRLPSLIVAAAVLVLAACSTPPKPPTTVTPQGQSPQPHYLRSQWQMLPGWQSSDFRSAWPAWVASCRVLEKRAGWEQVCRQAQGVDGRDAQAIRAYFESQFLPYRLMDQSYRHTGLVTGYYEPLLRGSLQRTAEARYPIYGIPSDLVSKGTQRGRIENGKWLPYYSNVEIAQGFGPRPEQALAWVTDPIELLFLQIQGSGRVELPDGRHLRVGFADHNGFAYQSVGRWLIDRGELKPNEASMQGIKAWAQANPQRLNELLAANPRYVFFRRLADAPTHQGPPGALGVPLTPEHSVAIDPRYTPLGAPIWLDTTLPLSSQPLQRLVFAQDTGSAIKGAVRADFFWGFGAKAGEVAGRMKQSGQMWTLLPRGVLPPAGVSIY